MVLVSTLKEIASKVTKRGRGPYVITKLSTSGAVWLSTLDGEEMPNWLSGCRIKKYHVPLTTEQLERLHQAKWRQEKKKIDVEMAQEEAKVRAQKLKQAILLKQGVGKRYKIEIIDDLDVDTPLPFIEVNVNQQL